MLWFQDISFVNQSFEDLPQEKKITPRISLICVLNHFLINCIHLKLLFRMYLKEMFFLKKKKNWDSLHARLNSHYEAWSYKKRSTKKITGYRKSV